jgi:hypothetical protein
LRPNQLPWALKGNGWDSLDICPQGKEKINSLLASSQKSKLSKQKRGEMMSSLLPMVAEI